MSNKCIYYVYKQGKPLQANKQRHTTHTWTTHVGKNSRQHIRLHNRTWWPWAESKRRRTTTHRWRLPMHTHDTHTPSRKNNNNLWCHIKSIYIQYSHQQKSHPSREPTVSIKYPRQQRNGLSHCYKATWNSWHYVWVLIDRYFMVYIGRYRIPTFVCIHDTLKSPSLTPF